MKTKTCLAIALLAGGSAAVQAERRPDWEQVVALAPRVDSPLAVGAFALPDPEAVEVPGFSSRHDVRALPLPGFDVPDPGAVQVPGFALRHEVKALSLPDFPYAQVWAAAELFPIPEFALAALAALPAHEDLPVTEVLAGLEVPDATLAGWDAADDALAGINALPGMDALADAGEPAPDGWTAVDGDSLDGMRGGFTMPGGLVVSLGIERLVSINGEVVARTSFALPTGGTAGDVATAAHDALGGGLIQNGPGNVSLATMAPEALGATIIQNTLNDQTIRSQTVINASVNSATLMQSLNFNDSLGQAIRNAIGSH